MEKKETKKGNGYGIAGLVLGIISIFFAWIGVIPLLAIIFSSIGILKSAVLGGKIISVIGLILGILYLILNMYQNGHFNQMGLWGDAPRRSTVLAIRSHIAQAISA